MALRRAERFRLRPFREPVGVGALDVAYDLTFELVVEPIAPYKQQQALLTLRVSDLDAESLAEGRLTESVNIENLTARAAYFAQERLRTLLAQPGSSERLFLQIPSSAVPALREIDPRRVQTGTWVQTLGEATAAVTNQMTPASTPDPNTPTEPMQLRRVFVVHGRNSRLRDGFFALLRTFDLEPIEWSEAIRETRKASPYIGEILDTAFSMAQAVMVILSPDDEVRLAPALHGEHESALETNIHHQPRPNVLFEAGMAFGRQPDRTILVEVGSVKPFSDVAGRHVVRLDNSKERRLELGDRLRVAGCPVRLDNPKSLSVGDFELPSTTPVTAMDKAPRQPIAVAVRWVDLQYPEDSGLKSKLEAKGYELRWAREDRVARQVDLEGWEPVVAEVPGIGRATFQVKDPMWNLLLLRRMKGDKPGS